MVSFHLNWKAMALHVRSLLYTAQGLSVLLGKLRRCSKIISRPFWVASALDIERVSKLRPFQDHGALVLCGNQVFKRFRGEFRPDEVSRGAPQSCG